MLLENVQLSSNLQLLYNDKQFYLVPKFIVESSPFSLFEVMIDKKEQVVT
jgi:hypothetical protein